MSLQSWKDEFYPKEPTKRMTKVAALKHSILKWTGLLPKNLEKHGLEKDGKLITSNEFSTKCLRIDSNSCALCVKYFHEEKDENECKTCPLCIHLGKPCDLQSGVYTRWARTGNPRPMLRALKATLKKVEAGEI